MALKAILIDNEKNPHLLIGLNREDVDSMKRGEVFVLPSGQNVALNEKSDIVLIIEETDEDLVRRMKAGVAPSGNLPPQ